MPVSTEGQNAARPRAKRHVPFFGQCVLVVATGFGLGRIPFAPGTFGALLGVPLALGVTALHGHLWTQIAIVVALALIAVPICDAAEEIFGEKDDGRIVADEYLLLPVCFVGQMPVWDMMMQGGLDAKTAVVFTVFVFLVSRLCDILKPSPARQVQRLHGGLGIVLDDFFASLYTWVLVWGLKDIIVPRIAELL